ncbi:hypothetical protein A3J20_05815 [Candidatus Gottesmanbacteria bacterium RIFCSPLOWO2_02_FULL_42_29]|uniref:ATP-grasp domain-containing protein n=2 Tax=Candidatus Gottesmaniibacteriota TaxID=1752720 RepID=A0A1F6BK96_9BACT|nr:MAG: 5-formaminoimidazole-4-carboxamide-1-(beta)-D-ribofuranosyl 5'-monophosphate synthetase [Candidatus Gottesmanbacteria bacterium GW2011_GWA2_42_18]KKS76108.1 MAG: 5-formaminoimidazole-4-carboxamide-1-(beta)-D-ribofuranosyl 5'-monophosphate synthetase [Candidatus Gottesmanbacteria bacterium GW2011_GWC2_42_8]OGG09401.1 MAG: hypothetical protein A2781_01405 [Candidatus Gottesmanbacteria bacterium RIFCSPHIGHO2_01_FULL_42_27]OGG23054.1 MAG: hypothetical protein A3E72_03410 [Candidatus Gottesma
MKNFSIATLASHTSLQILKGAKDEGFRTLAFCINKNEQFYRNFQFIDKLVTLGNYRELIGLEKKLANSFVIMIPHGSFVAYLGKDFNRQTKFKYFGNKKVLEIEGNRLLQKKMLDSAGLKLPLTFLSPNNVDRPVIVKTFGARGGSGYFLAKDKAVLKRQLKEKQLEPGKYLIQEYIIGIPVYIQYFYSALSRKLEITGVDRRYESDVDGLGRLPAEFQLDLKPEPDYTVIGNFPIVLRESLLPQIYEMGQQIVNSSKIMAAPKGLFGPFCLETIITRDSTIYTIEISCRIVAGTNLYIKGSPYMDLLYDIPMSVGRRIAREIKQAIKQRKLAVILT